MTKNDRYLTKSLFKLAMECPTKLFYAKTKDICTGKILYANQKENDSFLQSLADGGHQVGELAKYYFKDRKNIETLNKEDALRQTNKLLELENVVVCEAAIKFKSLFVRADILVKRGNKIKLIEVKSKGIRKGDSLGSSGWKPYLYDVAFQKYVLSKAFNQFSITAYLMLIDKDSVCSVDDLNQKFELIEKDKRRSVRVSPEVTREDLGEKILIEVNVDDYCEKIYKENFLVAGRELSFSDQVEFFMDYYVRDEKIRCKPSSKCSIAKCKFRATEVDKKNGLRCGFSECWMNFFDLSEEEIKEPTVLNIWNISKKKNDNLIKYGIIKLSNISKLDLKTKNVKIKKKQGFSRFERQWLQVEKFQNNDKTIYIDKKGLKTEMLKWNFPLHFIDFETAQIAIPFNKGQRPYEQIAFQFSHHVLYENGRIDHKGQYINLSPGEFPNYEFLRELKSQLESDKGTIFRYCYHENTILNAIYDQLKNDKNEIEDRELLCSFIKSITTSGSKQKNNLLAGERNMVDLCNIVERFYFDPNIENGSTSLKQILPSILNRSKYLQKKYAKPIYGVEDGIKSFNYNDDYKSPVWVQFNDDGSVKDPYELLPLTFSGRERKNETIKFGGLTRVPYAKMQFRNVPKLEREETQKGLLRYCELDTLAMVMLYEGLKDLAGD